MSTERIAKFVVQTTSDQIPREAVETAKKSMLDFLGVALGGSLEPASTIMKDYVKEAGGRPESSVIGAGFKTAVAQAALVNGVMGHALDYDDYGINWLGHPSVAIVPAVLALGEKRQASGCKCLYAFFIYWELLSKVSLESGANSI